MAAVTNRIEWKRWRLSLIHIYVPAGDVAALTAAITELATDPGRRRDLGQALRRRVQVEFSWPAAAERIANLYDLLTNRGD